jgi:hypothetical protein
MTHNPSALYRLTPLPKNSAFTRNPLKTMDRGLQLGPCILVKMSTRKSPQRQSIAYLLEILDYRHGRASTVRPIPMQQRLSPRTRPFLRR